MLHDINYSRYGSYNLRNMEKLPQEVLLKFIIEEHVMRHQQGYWNSIWSDMYIKTTFMRYGKSPGGFVRVTLNPGVVKKWATSLHISTEFLNDLDEMRDRETSKDLEFHTEETKGQLKSYEEDRASLRNTLKRCINPLETDVNGLVNIYSRIKVENSNAYESVKLGEHQHQQFEASWPDGFYNIIKMDVRTMKSGKKCSKSGEIEVFNTELIYSRVMCLLSIARITLEDVLNYGLFPIPLSLFELKYERDESFEK